MKRTTSYEDVMRALQEQVAYDEYLDKCECVDIIYEQESNANFKMEYAHESLTERKSVYRRRMSNV